MQTVIFLLSGIVIFILVVINAILIWRFYRTSKRLDTLLEKGKIKDFKDAILTQKERNDLLQGEIKDILLKIKDLENVSLKTIQKTAIVRFNPFNNIGGNQSFVIALLDAKNNGLVISSLFVKEGNRVYTKDVKQGKSEYKLSEEEKEAIALAMESKKGKVLKTGMQHA